MPTGTLRIDELEVWSPIGVPDAERGSEQRLLVTAELTLDLTAIIASDDVTKGIDYDRIAEGIRELAKIERKTIERFADEIAEWLSEHFDVASVRVTVQKFAIPGARSASVTVSRP